VLPLAYLWLKNKAFVGRLDGGRARIGIQETTIFDQSEKGGRHLSTRPATASMVKGTSG